VTWQKKLDDTLTSGLEIAAKLQKILLLGALPPLWATFRTTQNSTNCSMVADLLANIKQEETMRCRDYVRVRCRVVASVRVERGGTTGVLDQEV
jgi:hypothetical protein